jgi:UTP--glucose-1-phosphate uridylyltransferase
MEYFYTRQRRQLGLGHAVLCAEPLVGRQPFVVALGDSIIGLNAESNIVQRMIDVFESDGADVVVAFEEVPRDEVCKYGIAKPRTRVGDVFELESVVEKPDVGSAPSNLAVAARYVFNPIIFDKLHETQPGKGGEIQLTDAIQRMLDDGCKGIGMRLASGEQRFDIGNFESYFRTFAEFALADPKYGPSLREFVKTLVR